MKILNRECLTLSFSPKRWAVADCYTYGSKCLPYKYYFWYLGPLTIIIQVPKNKRERGKPVFHYYFGHLKKYFMRQGWYGQ